MLFPVVGKSKILKNWDGGPHFAIPSNKYNGYCISSVCFCEHSCLECVWVGLVTISSRLCVDPSTARVSPYDIKTAVSVMADSLDASMAC